MADVAQVEGWSRSKAPSLTCPMINPGHPLGASLVGASHVASPCGLGFLKTWRLLSKGRYLTKKREQGEGCTAFDDLV